MNNVYSCIPATLTTSSLKYLLLVGN